ncbi:hypothetical protein GCM10023068_35020 [Leifsonia shinshuensis]
MTVNVPTGGGDAAKAGEATARATAGAAQAAVLATVRRVMPKDAPSSAGGGGAIPSVTDADFRGGGG